MPRPSNKDERRKQIVEGLLEVMSKKGYENASIQAIGKACGLTPGLIHYHFKSKQEILVALIKTLSSIAWDRYEELLEKATSPKEKLEAFIDAALSLGPNSNEKAVSAWVIIGAEAIRQAEVQELYQEIINRNKLELIARLSEYATDTKAMLTAQNIENIAMMSIASIEGAYQLATTAKEISPKGYAADTVKRFIFSLLHNS
ncbi:TetR/AcrR family transcriptional regulator [Hahella ganghwensis]|uniref:TetR/AcrR family transcriptional regulator n=1 Tax=Hahella ganghwensis TaxID=286420 RepID=UPI0003661931|nr:TetR family transcriptional regulator [Hahella ganghwensis]